MNNDNYYRPQPHSSADLPAQLYSQILPGLFMGGTEDWDTVEFAADVQEFNKSGHFDAVATMYAYAQPCGWNVEEFRLGIYDHMLDDSNIERVLRLATWAHQRWQSGERVLVRCQAGLNRSGLIMALVLMLEGLSAQEAIETIRAQRSPFALFNKHFVTWLLNDADTWVALHRAPAKSPSAA